MKVGDKVLVRKPVDLDEGPGWVSEMDKYDGTVQEIYETGKHIYTKSSEWKFLKKWLTPVFEHEGKYYRIADKADIGSQVTVSDQSEKVSILNNFNFRLTAITSEELPFIAGGESWKYALVQIKQEPAVTSTKTLEEYLEDEGIWCETYEEKYALLSYLGDTGYEWNSGSKVHGYDWQKRQEYGDLRAKGKRLTQSKHKTNQIAFSTISKYDEIMKKYAPAAADTPVETPADTPAETPKEAEMFVHQGKKYRLATKDDIGKEMLFSDYGLYNARKLTLRAIKDDLFVTGGNLRWKYAFFEIPQKENESSKSEEMLGSDVIPTEVNWDVPFSKEFMTVTYNPATQVEWDKPVTTCQKTEETPLTKEETSVESKSQGMTYAAPWWSTGWMVSFDPPNFGFSFDEKSSESEKKMAKPSMFVVNTLIRPSASCPLPVIVNYLDSKGYRDLRGCPLKFYDEGNSIRIQRDKQVLIYQSPNNTGRCVSEFAEYEEIISPAAKAAKPQKESKMALFSLASKKVRGLAYGALDWAFISPLKRTFKPVATIAQFSICYLTLAAAGYFAYGLYQNPQSVVEWISEISPVEIRLKNTEE